MEKVVEETCTHLVEVMIARMAEDVMGTEVVVIYKHKEEWMMKVVEESSHYMVVVTMVMVEVVRCRYKEARRVVVVVIYTHEEVAAIVMEAGRTCGDVVALGHALLVEVVIYTAEENVWVVGGTHKGTVPELLA